MGVKIREKPKGSGIWWIFINHRGQRKSKKIGRDIKLAREVAKKVKAKLVLGDLNISSHEKDVPKFKDYAENWTAVTLPATCKPSTIRDYEGLLDNHVLPVFGKIAVTDINKLMVKNFLMKKINDDYASSTVTHMKNTISGVLNLAIDDEVISGNPAHKIGKIFKVHKMGSLMDPLNRKELSIFLKIVKDHFSRNYPLILTLARTGMRLGETLGLQWGDIDFNSRFITVQRSLSKGKVGTPKNGKIRKVDMSFQLAETLKKLKHQRKLETLKKGWKEVPEWVFINEEGNCIHDKHWRNKIFYKALEKAKLRRIRIHDLRHTYASLLIQAGESLAYIRDQLGHHSIKVTVDICGHLAPEGNKEAVDRLDDSDFNTPFRTPTAPQIEKANLSNG